MDQIWLILIILFPVLIFALIGAARENVRDKERLRKLEERLNNIEKVFH